MGLRLSSTVARDTFNQRLAVICIRARAPGGFAAAQEGRSRDLGGIDGVSSTHRRARGNNGSGNATYAIASKKCRAHGTWHARYLH
ncbi:hypothetical protein PLICRDRAFT_372209 [Plicaturopsis crispa FD-325 SS-3]|uniref:Uncharacterized protein n=1 Tax=Plicaturopsis crispa FD-325 SS-3 TaxID=944288 RepID=A0A0C9T4D1_PLICR|nr:hypothetical protein PLICRDRAFT_372209 [Plicaturopsis crispa FD-325 SS-3]